jgi:hypothetical protein
VKWPETVQTNVGEDTYKALQAPLRQVGHAWGLWHCVLYPTLNALAQRSADGAASLGKIEVLSDDTERVLDSSMMQLDMTILNNEPCKVMIGRDDDGMTGSSRELGVTQPAVNLH